MGKKTAKHRAEPQKLPLRNRIAYARNRWHLKYKPLLISFASKGPQ